MKYVDEFRDGDLARRLAAAIAREAASGRRPGANGVGSSAGVRPVIRSASMTAVPVD